MDIDFYFLFFPWGSKIKGLKKKEKMDLNCRSYLWSIAIVPSQYKLYEIKNK